MGVKMIVEMNLEFSEANLLFSLLQREIEAVRDCNMDEADKDYVLKDYCKLLRKLERTKNRASEYDGG